MSNPPLFNTEKWINLMYTGMVAGICVTIYILTTFETKGESDKKHGELRLEAITRYEVLDKKQSESNALNEKRLDRIETKVDLLLQRR